MPELIISTIIKEGIKLIASQIKEHLNRDDEAIEITKISDSIEEYISNNAKSLLEWSSTINLEALVKSRKLKEAFLDIDLNLHRRSKGLDSDDRTIKSSLIYLHTSNLIIFGVPGAGKTTTVKKNVLDCLETGNRIPILIMFRNLKSDDTLYDYVLRQFGLILKPKIGLEETELKEYKRIYIRELLKSNSLLLFFDGLDEVNIKIKEEVLSDLNVLLLDTDKGKIIITSRTGGAFSSLSNVEHLELAPLNDPQIRDFTSTWLGKKKSTELIKKIKSNPYHGTEVRPLTLAHLCALYEVLEDVPEQPIQVYSLIVNLLIKEWDIERRVKHKSDIENFNVITVEKLLISISYQLTIKGIRGSFNKNDIQNSFMIVAETIGFRNEDFEQILKEIESHTGLILKNGFDSYEYSHLSIQEYLTARYLVTIPGFINKQSKPVFADEFAIATALSFEPNEYFISIVCNYLEYFRDRFSDSFFGFYIKRLIIEKPDFRESERLGIFITLLICFFSSDHRFEEFFKNKVIMSSLQKAKSSLALVKQIPYQEDHKYHLLIDFDGLTKRNDRFLEDPINFDVYKSISINDKTKYYLESIIGSI